MANTKLNVPDRAVFKGDNLDILRGINSGSVDLIYLDPPFNTKKSFTAPIGSNAEGASFKDIFYAEDIKDEWLETIKFENTPLYNFLLCTKTAGATRNYCYLCYMAIRLLECHRVLKSSGGVYLHVDPTMSHYLKVVMDSIFGEDNFRNEIIWHYKNKQQIISDNFFIKATDNILFYAKTAAHKIKHFVDDADNGSRGAQVRARGYNKRSIGGKHYVDVYDWRKYNALVKNGKLSDAIPTRDLSDKETIRYGDNCWNISIINPRAKERTGYPTQKPLALLERILTASSNEGDTVLDPFCSCATTCIAAERLNRNWLGIDISIETYNLLQQRLKNEVPKFKKTSPKNTINFSASAPKRTDQESPER